DATWLACQLSPNWTIEKITRNSTGVYSASSIELAPRVPSPSLDRTGSSRPVGQFRNLEILRRLAHEVVDRPADDAGEREEHGGDDHPLDGGGAALRRGPGPVQPDAEVEHQQPEGGGEGQLHRSNPSVTRTTTVRSPDRRGTGGTRRRAGAGRRAWTATSRPPCPRP